MNMKVRVWQTLFFGFMFEGCSLGPVYEEPQMEMPSMWHSDVPGRFHTSSSEDLIWWECLQDATLNALISCAATQNLDLQIAAIRVLQARAAVTGKKADLYPRIDGSVNSGHILYSQDAMANGLLSTTLPLASHHHKRKVDFYEFGFDAQWEIDLFGLTAHEISALRAQEEAVQESLCAIWVTLSAEIAKNYIELRGLQQRLEIAKRNIDVQTEVLQLTEELIDRGVVNESDYRSAQAEWNALKGELPLIELNMARASHRLSILLGLAPGDLCDGLSASNPLPCLPAACAIGMPSELLRRRPDIRKAERELAAATERVGSAIAALFPRFSLRGFLGDISTHAGSIFNPSSATAFVGPQLLVPIFNSRLLLQDVNYNKRATQEALLIYQKTVLEALEESENAIASFHFEEQRQLFLSEAHQKHLKALELAESLYQNGVIDSFALIKAKKAALLAEQSQLQSQIELLINYVSIYKALGGSWGRDH